MASDARTPGPNPHKISIAPVLYLHCEGYAPSQIAAKLGSSAGSVRREVVAWWAGRRPRLDVGRR